MAKGFSVFKASSFLLIGAQLAQATPPPARPEIKIAVVQEWSHLNPITSNLASTDAFLGFAVRPLVNRKANGELVADLAEKIPSKKNKLAQVIQVGGKSKVIARWTIKEKAQWGDLKPLTCKDWWLGWQVGLSPNVTTAEKSI